MGERIKYYKADEEEQHSFSGITERRQHSSVVADSGKESIIGDIHQMIR